MSVSRPGKEQFLARRAYEAKKYSVWRKLLLSLLIMLVLLITIVYIVSVLYTKFGSFTVTVNKYDANRYGLCLSETPQFETQISRLNARTAEDITNISVNDLPKDVDSINGQHNGDNHLAYTFYLTNVGDNTVTFEYHMFITNVHNDVDKAIRIRIYRDGEPTTYARTRSDGTGPEDGCVEFLTSSTIVREQVKEFKPGDVTKFTVVMWIEGDDPDCIDDLLGGSLKSDMSITVIESEPVKSGNLT